MKKFKYALVGLAFGIGIGGWSTVLASAPISGGHMIFSGEAAGAKMYTFDDGFARCYIGQYVGTPVGMQCTFYTEAK